MIRSFALLLLAMPFVSENASADGAPSAEPSTVAAPTPEKPNVMWIDDEDEETSIRKGMGLDGYEVTYKDADRTPINFQQFSAGLAAGRTFSALKDTDKKVAMLALEPENEAPPGQTSPTDAVKVGDTLPAFNLQDLHGRNIDTATLKGRPTLLSFHFAECVPCIAEIPMLNTFARDNPEFNLFAVTFDDTATATKFASEHDYDWPILANAQAFIDTLGVKVYPSMLLIDADGSIRAMETGTDRFTDETRLRDWTGTALAP